MLPIRSAAICLLRQGRSTLVVTDTIKEIGKKVYKYPGGKVDPGESRLEAAMREVREETGYRVLGARLRGRIVYNSTDTIWRLYVFESTSFEGELDARSRHRPGWIDIEGIPFRAVSYMNRRIDQLVREGRYFAYVIRYGPGHKRLEERVRYK